MLLVVCVLLSSNVAHAICVITSPNDTKTHTEQDTLRYAVESFIGSLSNPSCALPDTAVDYNVARLSIGFYTPEIRKVNDNEGTSVRYIEIDYKKNGNPAPIKLSNTKKLIIGNPSPESIHSSTAVAYPNPSEYYQDPNGSGQMYDSGYIVIDYRQLEDGESPYITSENAQSTIIRNHVFIGSVSKTQFFSNSKLIDGGDNYFCVGDPKLIAGIPAYYTKDPSDWDLSEWCELPDDYEDDCPKKTVYYDKDGDNYGKGRQTSGFGGLEVGLQYAVEFVDGEVKMVPLEKEICEDEPVPAGYSVNNGDCNDRETTVNPAAPEICDQFDNDCDGQTNEYITCEMDEDGDGYVTDGDDFPYENNEDCDDSDPTVHPGATEICDGIDNDCDGVIDDNCTENLPENDDDGDGYSEDDGDCDDTDVDIHPGAEEVCSDSRDNDCDGDVDEADCSTIEEIDNDGDGYSELTGDCDDADASVNPDATEICDDGIDNDCNGYIDIDCGGTSTDIDGDGYSIDDGDCNDADSTINPGASEICGDAIDSNCDGNLNEGCTFEICDDGQDNNGNGLIDCDDSDCSTHYTCNGLGQETECNDGSDNDGDGAMDCTDSDCFFEIACTATFNETDCGDGIDSDGDGLVDCDDSDCDGVEYLPGEFCQYTGPTTSVGALTGSKFGCSLNSDASQTHAAAALLFSLMGMLLLSGLRIKSQE